MTADRGPQVFGESLHGGAPVCSAPTATARGAVSHSLALSRPEGDEAQPGLSLPSVTSETLPSASASQNSA